MVSGTGLRARKKAATEAALQRAALELFRTKGYEATTIEEIVAAADVSRRTFFRYFPSKEEVIFSDAEADMEAMRILLRQRPQGESELEVLKEALVAFVDYLQERKAPVLELVDVILASSSLRGRSAELQGRWSAGVAEELAARAGVGVDMKRRLLASVGIAALTGAIQAWNSGAETDLETAIRKAFVPVEDGTLFD